MIKLLILRNVRISKKRNLFHEINYLLHLLSLHLNIYMILALQQINNDLRLQIANVIMFVLCSLVSVYNNY